MGVQIPHAERGTCVGNGIGFVAVGVQEQAEDILVPPLLRNCLTLNVFLVIISPPVVLAMVFTV